MHDVRDRRQTARRRAPRGLAALASACGSRRRSGRGRTRGSPGEMPFTRDRRELDAIVRAIPYITPDQRARLRASFRIDEH